MQVNNVVDAGDAVHKHHIAIVSEAGHTHSASQKISKAWKFIRKSLEINIFSENDLVAFSYLI